MSLQAHHEAKTQPAAHLDKIAPEAESESAGPEAGDVRFYKNAGGLDRREVRREHLPPLEAVAGSCEDRLTTPQHLLVMVVIEPAWCRSIVTR